MTTMNDLIREAVNKPKISHPSEVPGWFNFHKAYDWAVKNGKDGDVFVEVGCFLGRSTAYLADLIKQSKKDIQIIAIDPWKTDLLDDSDLSQVLPAGDFFSIFLKNMKDLKLDKYIKPMRMTSEAAFAKLKYMKFKFICIDGLHDKQNATYDISHFKTLLTPDGCIMGDDYKCPSVTESLNEIYGENNYFVSDGVWPFWSDKQIV